MQIGNRFHCSPTSVQQGILLQWIGAQRFVYNAKVQEDRYLRAFARKFGGKHMIDQQYAQFRAESPWMSEIPGVVLRNGAVRWKAGYTRYFKKLAKRPSIHKRTGEQSVWLTNELFRFAPVIDADGVITGYRLLIGTKKHPLGELAFTAHRTFQPPASLHVGVHNGRWHVSFNYDDGVPEPSDKDTAAWLMQFGEAELHHKTFGGDRGVVIPLAGNRGETFDLDPIQKKRIARKQAAARRWQRKIARRPKGSANRRKAIARVGKLRAYEAKVRTDFAHQTSHALAEDPACLLYVFEALGVQRMTRKPKAKPDPDHPGHFLKNQARAKAGLNSAILRSCWGRTRTCLAYKARRKGKLLIDVPPHHTSQECSRCGHIHPDNRETQARFVCQACLYSDNADHNAAKVIARRGVQLLLSGAWASKEKQCCALRKEDPMIGAGCAESPAQEAALATPVETTVSRGRRKTAAHMSMTQEREAPPSVCGAN